MIGKLQEKLTIPMDRLSEINALLLDHDNKAIQAFLDVVAKYGTPEEINRRAAEARRLDRLTTRLREIGSPYVSDLEWLTDQCDREAFVSVADYRRKVLGDRAERMALEDGLAVTLEISALQYFPWLIAEARQAIERQELMPGRFIRVRKMKEQVEDGDILAVAAAMQIIGASYVETLDTKGTDGANIHLGGPETITGYFGGIGEPNEYAPFFQGVFLSI